jgi:hypothetical protein
VLRWVGADQAGWVWSRMGLIGHIGLIGMRGIAGLVR